MNYTKPTVVLLGPAIEAIQSGEKPGGLPDNANEQSAGAYEADE